MGLGVRQVEQRHVDRSFANGTSLDGANSWRMLRDRHLFCCHHVRQMCLRARVPTVIREAFRLARLEFRYLGVEVNTLPRPGERVKSCGNPDLAAVAKVAPVVCIHSGTMISGVSLERDMYSQAFQPCIRFAANDFRREPEEHILSEDEREPVTFMCPRAWARRVRGLVPTSPPNFRRHGTNMTACNSEFLTGFQIGLLKSKDSFNGTADSRVPIPLRARYQAQFSIFHFPHESASGLDVPMEVVRKMEYMHRTHVHCLHGRLIVVSFIRQARSPGFRSAHKCDDVLRDWLHFEH
jgi:hypothetical protein